MTNSEGAGNYTDTFVYTEALSTVAPTGNVTVSATGAAASASDLDPNPANLQVSPRRLVHEKPGVGGR